MYTESQILLWRPPLVEFAVTGTKLNDSCISSNQIKSLQNQMNFIPQMTKLRLSEIQQLAQVLVTWEVMQWGFQPKGCCCCCSGDRTVGSCSARPIAASRPTSLPRCVHRCVPRCVSPGNNSFLPGGSFLTWKYCTADASSVRWLNTEDSFFSFRHLFKVFENELRSARIKGRPVSTLSEPQNWPLHFYTILRNY